MTKSLNKRFWISTLLGSVAMVLFSCLMWGGLQVWAPFFEPVQKIFGAMEPHPGWVLGVGMSLLVSQVVALNLLLWLFVRWGGCLGWTGVLRITLLFAFAIHVPTHLGYALWVTFPGPAAVALMTQGFLEILLAGLIASYFIRSEACAIR